MDWRNLFNMTRFPYVRGLFHMSYYQWDKEHRFLYQGLCYVEVRHVEVHCTTTANPSWYLFTCLTLSFFITYLRFCSLLFILAHSNNKLAKSANTRAVKSSVPLCSIYKVSFYYLRINIWKSKSFYCPHLLTSSLCILTTQSRITGINLRLSYYIDQPPIHRRSELHMICERKTAF